MKTFKFTKIAACALAIAGSCGITPAQQPTITSFGSNGQLTWTNPPGTNAFTVQWAPTAVGPWSGNWQTLDSVVSTGRQTTVSVPMFYRVAQGFTTASLRGPWLLSLTPTNYSYLWFDGAGTITEAATFFPGIPCGYYSVQATGTVTSTFLYTHDGPRSAQGRFVSGQSIAFDPPFSNLRMSQVQDASRCQGHWTGALVENGGLTTPVSFNVDASGLLSNFVGLPDYVVGRMLSDSTNRVSAFFRNGAGESNPYNQVQVIGTLTGNVVNGVFYLDQGGNTPAGTVNLQRQ